MIAGLVGGLFGGLFVQFEAARFAATESLLVIAVAVVGGLSSVGGVVFGVLFVVGLPASFQDSDEVALLTSGVGLLILLMYFPGGFVQVVLRRTRHLVFDGSAWWMPAVEPAVAETPLTSTRLAPLAPVPEGLDAVIRARGVTVRYGTRARRERGRSRVDRGEVVGLIGAQRRGQVDAHERDRWLRAVSRAHRDPRA